MLCPECMKGHLLREFDDKPEAWSNQKKLGLVEIDVLLEAKNNFTRSFFRSASCVIFTV